MKQIQKRSIEHHTNYWKWMRQYEWEYAFTLTFKDDLYLSDAKRLAVRYFSDVDLELYGKTLKQHKNSLKRMVFIERAPARRRHRNGIKKKDWKGPDSSLYITNWDSNSLKRNSTMEKIRAGWTKKAFWHIHGLLILPKDLPYNQKANIKGFRTSNNIIQLMNRKWNDLLDLKHKDEKQDRDLKHPAGSCRFDRIQDDTQRGKCITYIVKATKGDWEKVVEDIYGCGDMLFLDVSNV